MMGMFLKVLSNQAISLPFPAVAPWFNTHFGSDTFNKNFIFFSDFLWQQRWDEVLAFQPQFVEILTWNGDSQFAPTKFFF
jgi:hypothetical protein